MEILEPINRQLEIQKKALGFAIMEYDAGAGEEGNNNSGPFVRKYLNGLQEPPANWCSAFVCWCIKEACECMAIPMPFEYTLSARRLFNIYKANGWIAEHPEEADIVFFWRDNPLSWMGHVGFVLSVYDKEIATNSWIKRLESIEGNKGYFPARVNKYKYDATNVPQLLGYGRIK